MVVKDGPIYLYYTYCGDGIVYDIRLATADANDPNWPAALTELKAPGSFLYERPVV